MVEELFNKIKESNKRYEENHMNGNLEKGPGRNYKIILGEIPVLFLAPHSVKQMRNGKIKSEDTLTGAIVEYICTTYKTFGITRTYNLEDDPNYYNSGFSLEYKNAIISCIRKYGIIDLFGKLRSNLISKYNILFTTKISITFNDFCIF